LSEKKVLEAALNFGALGVERGKRSASPLASVVLFVCDDQPQMGTGRRLATADRSAVSAGQTGILGNVLRTGEAAVIDDPAQDPELAQFPRFQSCRSLFALPLRAGYEIYGVALYGHRRPHFFDECQRALLASEVNQAIIGLSNAQLIRSLRQAKEQVIEAHEQTQKKLARDLHDGPVQAALALATRANFARYLLKRDVNAAGEELLKVEALARRTNKELRLMLFTLRPLLLENQGLSAALRQLAEKTKATYGQNVIVEADRGADGHLDMPRGTLFYIVEEAVNNARKHARADHIWVRLKRQEDALVVEVQDDGAGFNVGAVERSYDQRGSLGLVNMRERAELINGSVHIESVEGRGTRVNVIAPLTGPRQGQVVPRRAPIGGANGKLRLADLDAHPAAAMALLTAHALAVMPGANQLIETPARPRAEKRAAAPGRWLRVGLKWAAASAAIVAVLLAGAGTAAASRQSVPGDLLYGVKRADESAQVFFSPASERAFVYVGLARQRLVEIMVLAKRGSSDAAILNRLSDDLIAETGAALSLVENTPAEGRADVLSTLISVTGDEQSTLAAVITSAPAEAQAGLERALQMASEHHASSVERLEQVLASHGGPASSTPTGTASATATATPTPGSQTEAQPKDTHIAPGQTNVPPGQTHVPPGQTNIPPGQTHVPPGQTNIPPGQTHVPPERTNVPPGRTNIPPGQTNIPPGQTQVPPGQTNIPPGQTNVPPGRTQSPRDLTEPPPEETNVPPGQTHAPPEKTHGPHG
jgi:signal transduction histidine kinase